MTSAEVSLLCKIRLGQADEKEGSREIVQDFVPLFSSYKFFKNQIFFLVPTFSPFCEPIY